MSSYVFDNTQELSCERLSFLERACDPATISLFEKAGRRTGWSCLEIGAGNGSIARWLSERVGQEGTVVVTDIEPRFLDGLVKPWTPEIALAQPQLLRSHGFPCSEFERRTWCFFANGRAVLAESAVAQCDLSFLGNSAPN